MAIIGAETDAVPQVMFRHGKKGKTYRQRAEGSSSATGSGETPDQAGHGTSNPTNTTTIERDEDEEGLSVAEVLRRRNARKHKQGGVGFRAGPSGPGNDAAASEENVERGLVVHGNADAEQGPEAAIIGGISKRFAPQTGLVGELVNKHMEEYVESELARRKRHAAEAAAQQQQQQRQMEQRGREELTSNAADGQLGSRLVAPGGQNDSQRVLQGRLLEIDLGDEARARNIEMTERARRRLQGQIDEEEDEEGKGRSKNGRLGRDGKPLRSRNRRGSDDIKRDQLVEEFLSENRLDMYDTTQSGQAGNSTALEDEEGAADDRIAEAFRREFMDAMAQRTRRRRMAHSSKPRPRKQEEILRGPKLGGSRNARAAMRDLLLKEQASKKKR
ncbi:hepatocellular carcinoma-associated antigen 59-domain-containing protein [Thermothelomyces heterothallicus CBS 202.75]|uniref:hepatocellular carcinoma-associated antigen 59-domain-containing protein n=1 Tax=Thermothelomyces heterothallicus CBS 202.75 TaxID=1149848 RepID=UPI0037444E69